MKKIEELLNSDFQIELLKAAIENLNDKTNKLRLNNYAYSMRELSRHFLKSLAPDNEVFASNWYRNETGEKDIISRGERIKYAIQGGLDNNFVNNEIIEIEHLNKLKTEITKSITALNKYTHINEDTFNIGNYATDKISKKVNDAFISFTEAINECREIIISSLEDKISNEFIEHTITESIDEIDLMATHHNIEEISPDHIKIVKIENANSIKIEVNGFVATRLQYGSDGDQRRGNGLVLHDSFPFCSILNASVGKKLKYSKVVIESFEVNTDSWYGEEEQTIK